MAEVAQLWFRGDGELYGFAEAGACGWEVGAGRSHSSCEGDAGAAGDYFGHDKAVC
jgi:hypothetical protein